MSNAIQKILKLFEEVAQNEGLFAEKMPEISELLKSFTNEDGKIILTKEQETFVKENGYDVNAFKETLVYADKLSKEIKQGNEVQENDSVTNEVQGNDSVTNKVQGNDSTTNEVIINPLDEKDQMISHLKQTLLNTYVRSKPKSIQQLKDEERTSEIARDYHKLRDKIEVEFLMQMNDNGKTFVHTLFEQNADVEDILFYLNQVNKHSPNILDSYLEISHDGITVNDLLREKAHTPKYSKLLDLNLGIDLATKKTIISEINTHTESVHKSVDQSFVRLANQYIARSFPSEKEQKSLCDSLVPVKDVSKSVANTIKINRNNSWKSKIDADLQKFEDDLKNKIKLLNSDNRDNLMKELYPTGYTEVELNGVIFKCNTALNMLKDIKADKTHGKHYFITPSNQESCGLNLREMVAISYSSLQDTENLYNKNQEFSNFIGLVDGLYRGRRGYNIDRKGDEEWKNPQEHFDDNKCQGGIINSLADGMRDHKFVLIKAINQNVVNIAVIAALPEMLENLSSYKDFNENYRESVKNWLKIGIIPTKLSEALQEEFFKRNTQGEYSKTLHSKLVANAFNSISPDQITERFKSLKASSAALAFFKELTSEIKEPSIDSFVKNGDAKYVLYLDSKELQKNEISTKLQEHLDQNLNNHLANIRLLNLYMQSTFKDTAQAATEKFDTYKNLITPKDKEKIFLDAFKDKDPEMAKFILSKMPDVINAKDNDGQTALHHAAKNADLETVKLLLNNMSEDAINAKDKYGRNALYNAAEKADLNTVKALVDRMSPGAIDAQDKHGYNALHRAAKNNPRLVEFLLDNMSDDAINAQDKQIGQTALHQAIFKADLNTAELLLRRMSKKAIDAKNGNGWNALMAAVNFANPKMVELLLDKMSQGAIDDKFNHDKTALHLAVEKADLNTAKLLLNKMSEDAIGAKNRNGQTALSLAFSKNNPALMELLISKMSPEAISASDDFGRTALMYAVYNKNLAMVKLLISDISPEAINSRNFLGYTALDLANKMKDKELINLLKQYKPEKYLINMLNKNASNEELKKVIESKNIDLNAKDDHGLTAIMIAARENRLEVVKMLIENGANIDTHGIIFKGKSALDYAKKDSNIEKLLLEAQKMNKSLNKDFSKAVTDICKSKKITEFTIELAARNLMLKQYKELSTKDSEKLLSKTQETLRKAVAERKSYDDIFILKRIFAAKPSTKKHVSKLLIAANEIKYPEPSTSRDSSRTTRPTVMNAVVEHSKDTDLITAAPTPAFNRGQNDVTKVR